MEDGRKKGQAEHAKLFVCFCEECAVGDIFEEKDRSI